MATIAEERAANARARAEGYESAAHKEAHANVGASAAGYANAVQQEIAANRRAQAAGFANAAEQEMDANRRAIAAGFTSAVDQEIDANRRARAAGYLNAADYESGLRTRSDAPFVDPRTLPPPVIPEQFRLGTANLLKYNPDQPNVPGYDPNWRDNYPGGFDFHGNPITGGGILGGPPNPTVPSFGYPGYQDWTRFMPTNFGLAEGGGIHYQPWLQGGGNIWGGGGNFVARPAPVFAAGGGYRPGVTYNPPTGYTPPGTGGGATGNVTTDAQGNEWIMSNGQWIPTTSELGGILAAGDTPRHPLGHYDSGGNWIGAEGGSGHFGYNELGQSIDHQGNVIDQGVAWQNSILGDAIRTSGWNINPVYEGHQTGLAPGFTQTSAPGYDYTMTAADLGLSNTASPVSTMQPGILNEAYAEAMGLGSEVDNSEEGGGWSDSAGFGIG